MTSHTTKRFRAMLDLLPQAVKRQAKEAYQLFEQNPYHRGLRFKQVHPSKPVYSARISQDYRAVGIRNGDEVIWFWIGSHSDYDDLLSRL